MDDHLPRTEPTPPTAPPIPPPGPSTGAWSRPVPPPSGPPTSPPSGGSAFGPIGAPPTSPPRRNRGFVFGALVGGLAGAVVASGIYLAVREDDTSVASVRTVSETIRPSVELQQDPTDIAGVLASLEPAVVAVTTGGSDTGFLRGGGSAGSGFVIREDGYIATNNHVVEGSRDIRVTFGDGTSAEATLIGTSPEDDLAVIKVDATGLPVAALGSSEALQVGDDVVAIGNALALEGGLSVTTGIVSALDRQLEIDANTSLASVVQTDAAINQGNSGGPLANAQGEVIGINTAVIDPGFAQNVGFAISIDHAKPILDLLIEGGDRKFGFLGVQTVNVTPAIAEEQGLSVESGALVDRVNDGTPAAAAGVEEGDVIVAVDGDPIDSGTDLATTIGAKQPGDTVTITVVRDGSEVVVSAELTERPSR